MLKQSNQTDVTYFVAGEKKYNDNGHGRSG